MEIRKRNTDFIIQSEYFDKIEVAIDYNQASSFGWAKKQLKLVLNAFLEDKEIVIEDLNVRLKNIEEYKEWKKGREKLNYFNSEELVKEIKLSNSRNQKW